MSHDLCMAQIKLKTDSLKYTIFLFSEEYLKTVSYPQLNERTEQSDQNRGSNDKKWKFVDHICIESHSFM